MRCTSPLVSLAILCAATSLPAQQHRLVKDIAPSYAYDEGSNPGDFVRLGGLALFGATSKALGREPWITDGTSSGTRLLKDCNAGPATGLRSNFAVLGAEAWFFASDGATGAELWSTDGTPLGTRLRLELVSGPASYLPTELHAAGSKLFLFVRADAASPYDLLVTDGTSAGTVKLSNVTGTTLTQATGPVFATASGIWFYGRDASSGVEPWFSDGTLKGTYRVQDFLPGSSVNFNNRLGFRDVGQGRVVFPVQRSLSPTSIDLAVSDGTAAGTFFLDSSATADDPEAFGELYFDGKRVWATGAVSAGDKDGVFVADLRAGSMRRLTDSKQLPMRGHSYFAHGGETWFRGFEATTGAELWRSDGTPRGTRLAFDMVPGSGSLDPKAGRSLGSHFVFSGKLSGVSSRALVVSDGTAAGTQELLPRAIGPYTIGRSSSGQGEMWFAVGSRLAFVAEIVTTQSYIGPEPWVTDGTVAGTGQLANIGEGSLPNGSAILQWQQMGGLGFFTAKTASSGRELWCSDGTNAGTRQLADIVAGTGSSDPVLIGSHAGRVWFSAWDATHGRELWTSDGTSQGTHLVADLDPGTGSSASDLWTALGSKVYFAAEVPKYGFEVHVSDGTSQGTRLLFDLTAGAASTQLWALETAGDRLFLLDAGTSTAGPALHVSDGSSATPSRIPLPAGHRESGFDPVVLGASLYFVTRDASFQYYTWVSDGTASGTVQLSAAGGALLATRDRVFWLHPLGSRGYQLYVSDGTAQGTKMLTSSTADTASALGALGTRALYTASNSQLYVSDGTVSGTKRLFMGAQPLGQGFALGARHFAVSMSGVLKDDLLITDGTVAGTFTRDLEVTVANSGATLLGMASGELFLKMNGPVGDELYALNYGATWHDAGNASGPDAPRLWTSDPLLGQTMTVGGTGAPVQDIGLLLLGAIESKPLPLAGAWLQVDTSLPILLDPFVVQSSNWQRSILLPNGKNFVGFRFALQALFLNAGTLQLQATRGIHARADN